VRVDGNRTYLATDNLSSNDELFVYDTTVVSSPVLLGSFDVGATVFDMVVQGGYAYLATSSDTRELDIINVSTPSSMSRVGSYNAPGSADMYGIALSGSTAYLARDSSGEREFYSVNVSSPSSPSLLGSLDFAGGDMNSVVVRGNYAYVATDSNTQELAVVNVSNPTAPVLSGSYDSSGNDNAESVALGESMLALGEAGGNNLIVFDLSSPGSPSYRSATAVGGIVYALAFDSNDAVFLATSLASSQAQRWDISAPATPVRDFSYNLNATAYGVYFNGTNAFFATTHNSLELQIFGPTVSVYSDYVKEGSFTSQVYDSGSTTTAWNSIE